MNDLQFIAFTGGYSSGKSTLCKKLVKKYTHSMLLSYGAFVRDELVFYLGSAGLSVKDVYAKPTPPYIRNLLKGWGDFRRSQDIDYWTNCMEDRINEMAYFGVSTFFIDDLRYANEFLQINQKPHSKIFHLGMDLTGQYDCDFIYKQLDTVVISEKPDVDQFVKEFLSDV